MDLHIYLFRQAEQSSSLSNDFRTATFTGDLDGPVRARITFVPLGETDPVSTCDTCSRLNRQDSKRSFAWLDPKNKIPDC